MNVCPSQHSPGVPLPKPRVVHRLLLVPQPMSRSVCLLPAAQMDGTCAVSLGVWFWILQLPQKHFCSWNDAKFSLLKGVQKNETSYVAWCWHQSILPILNLLGLDLPLKIQITILKGLQSKMQLENMKCRISHMCPQRNWTEGLISVKDSFAKDQDLGTSATNLTNEHMPRSSPYPQAMSFWWDFLLFGSSPKNRACPKPTMDSPVACYSLWFPNHNSSAIP